MTTYQSSHMECNHRLYSIDNIDRLRFIFSILSSDFIIYIYLAIYNLVNPTWIFKFLYFYN